MSRKFVRLLSAVVGLVASTACRDELTGVSPALAPGAQGPNRAVIPSAPQRVKWRLKIPGDYSLHAPAVGTDGTVYVVMSNGKLNAVAPNGALKWQFNGATWQVSLGADGTIYTNNEVVAPGSPYAVGAVNAITPSGALKWQFTGTGDFIMAGPNVGPDGNIYAVTDITGIGFFSLTPAGQLRFKTGRFTEHGFLGERIAFGPGRAYFSFDMSGTGTQGSLFGYDLNGALKFRAGGAANNSQPTVGPNGNVVLETFPSSVGWSIGAYTPAGAQAWSFYEFPGNTEEHPDVGPDNAVYTVRNLGTLVSLTPSGAVRWRFTDTTIMFTPRVRPQNDLVFMGGRITYGEPGYFQAVSTGGAPLWRVDLPVEPGLAPYGQLVPTSTPVFSPDGNTAYVVADVAGDGSVPYPQLYAYLYAIDVSNGTVTPPPPPPPVNVAPTATISAPAAGASFVQGTSVTFTGAGSDPEDGALSGASLAWTSSRNGALGTGASLSTSALSVGTHTITLTAKDSKGLTGSATRAITVTAPPPPPPPPGNKAPVASFTYSCATGVPHRCVMDASGSTDDVGVVSYTWSYGNEAPKTFTTPQWTETLIRAATVNITLRVTDAGGLTSSVTKAVKFP